ncbi:MAG: formyltransferase [Burkholderiaceae bacterium]|jgi:methionyl-tRNA formyltransferase
MRAVVFAYHNVGVRCLKVLCAGGIDVALVVTHADRSDENIWFQSVEKTASEFGIKVITPELPAGAADLEEAVRAVAPDFIFSFYYRHMLPGALLKQARRGAYNMHGSLLPHYRGRVPINWAILRGETVTGATLHEMVEKPDAGAIVGQTAVPILPDDIASEVFAKVTVAAEQTLWQVLPALIAGNAEKKPNHIAEGSYFGRRKPEDGRIDWSKPLRDVYNLVRAVAPPYPGAFCEFQGRHVVVARARPALGDKSDLAPGLAVRDNSILGVCGDGGTLLIQQLLSEGREIGPREFAALLQRS